MDISGKNIILTGAGSGIGQALLEDLVPYDTRIVAADLYPENIPDHQGQVLPVKCDVSDPEQINALFDRAAGFFGPTDIFIANAGFAYYEKVTKADWGHMDRLFSTNLMSPIFAHEKMLEIRKKEKFLTVVVASLMAKLPLPGYALYSASKAGLDAFFYAHGFEDNENARVMMVYPVATRTKFFKQAGDKDTPVAWPVQTPEQVSRAIIDGMEKDKSVVYPHKLAHLIRFSNLVPVLFHPTALFERSKFRKWLKGSA